MHLKRKFIFIIIVGQADQIISSLLEQQEGLPQECLNDRRGIPRILYSLEMLRNTLQQEMWKYFI